MKALRDELDKVLKAHFMRLVETSEWVSPIVVAPKKVERWKICVDFKPLNATINNPLPLIDHILHSTIDYERYNVCDGFLGYFLIKDCS